MSGEILDFLAGCLIQYGNYLKIRKNHLGWMVSMIAIIYWVIRAHTTGFSSQMFWHMVSFMMASYGYLSWRKEYWTTIQAK